ncbi:unnamed protein product, partial [marine sediment metagenome]
SVPIIDGRLEVYRRAGAGAYYLDGETQWFIRKFGFSGDFVRPLITIQAFDLNHLIDRRYIEYAAGTSYTNKTDFIDDMMKEIIDENAGPSAVDADRDMSPWLTIQADLSLAPSATKGFSWRKMLPVLQELAETSFENGTWLGFDIVKSTNSISDFRTYIDQRGVDLTGKVVVSDLNGSLAKPNVVYDYSKEITEVTAAGRGEGLDRSTVSVVDPNRSIRSPLNRIEKATNAAQTDITAS